MKKTNSFVEIKTIIFVLTATIFTLFFNGCEKEKEEEPEQMTISGNVINHTDCKSFKSVSNIDEVADTLSCIDYTFYQTENKLFLKHINTGFNCCPGELTCEISFSSDTIIIREFEEAAYCDCNCLFDLEIEINGIESKKYYLKFIEPYCGDQEKLFFEIDLSNNSQGTYCVFRDQYPWGLF